MTKDEIQAAIIFINYKFDQDYIETEEYYHIFKYHGDTIRAALQSAQVKAETVDLDEVSNHCRLRRYDEEKDEDYVARLVDNIAKYYNITRKTK